MAFSDIILYTWTALPGVSVSFILFISYSIIEMLNLFKSYDENSLTAPKTKKQKLIYVYFTGYIKTVTKTLLSLFTIFIIITVIFVLLSGILTMLKGESIDVNSQSLESAISETKSGLMGSFILVVNRVTQYILGVYTIDKFIILYFVLIPIILLIFISFYVTDVNNRNKMIHQKLKTEITKNDIFYITMFLYFISILFLYIYYFNKICAAALRSGAS